MPRILLVVIIIKLCMVPGEPIGKDLINDCFCGSLSLFYLSGCSRIEVDACAVRKGSWSGSSDVHCCSFVFRFPGFIFMDHYCDSFIYLGDFCMDIISQLAISRSRYSGVWLCLLVTGIVFLYMSACTKSSGLVSFFNFCFLKRKQKKKYSRWSRIPIPRDMITETPGSGIRC